MTHWTLLTHQLVELLHLVGRSARPWPQFRLTHDVLGGMGPTVGGLSMAGFLLAVGYLTVVTLGRRVSTIGWLFATNGRHIPESALLIGDRCWSDLGTKLEGDRPARLAWRPHASSCVSSARVGAPG